MPLVADKDTTRKKNSFVRRTLPDYSTKTIRSFRIKSFNVLNPQATNAHRIHLDFRIGLRSIRSVYTQTGINSLISFFNPTREPKSGETIFNR